MRIKSLVWLTALLVLALPTLVRGYAFIKNNGANVTWPAGTITMKIMADNTTFLSDNTTRAGSIQAAMQAWNAQLGTVQFSSQVQAAASGADHNGTNEIFFSGTAYGQAWDSNTLAVTTIWYNTTTSRRTEGDIIFNTNFTWDSYRGALRSPEDIRRIALHELGHVLGLDHPDLASPAQFVAAIMNSTESDIDALQPDDIAGAQILYGAPNSVPSFNFQPFDQAVYAGQSVTFSVGASGSPAPSYRWQRLPAGSGTWANLSDNATYSGSGTSILTIAPTTTAMNGDEFRCVATNLAGTATSNAATLLVTAMIAPSFTGHPSSQNVTEGNPVTFTVAATGVPSPTLQWQKNGVNIIGATGTSYTIASTVADDAGSYTAVATNLAGSATSNAAVLTVTGPPTITLNSSTRQVLSPGQSLSLSTSAVSPGSVTYQWIHNGHVVADATGASLAVASVASGDGGWYVLCATNANGTRRSAPMFVIVAPTVTEIRAWGSNGYGELTLPGNLTDAVAVAAGDVTGLALKRDGTVVAWGRDGNTTTPAGLNNVVSVAAGPFQSLALKSDGTVVTWGWYNSGYHPVPAGLNNVVAIAANELHSMALKSDGTVVIWGDDNNAVPADLTGVVAIAAPDYDSSLALKSDGTVVYWNNTTSKQSLLPAGLADVTAISAGQVVSLALKSDGTVVAWGYDGYGYNSTVVPAGLSGVVAIDAGTWHSLALKNDGTVVAWGANDSGQSTVPAGLSNVFAVSAGTWFSVALRDATQDTIPVITAQPASQIALVEDTVTFSVGVTSSSQVTYQWRKGGTNISGANGATLTLSNLTVADAGSYDVVVTDFLGSVTSVTVTLVVHPRPSVTVLSPTRNVLTPGQALNLSVSASGTGTLGYQWYRSGKMIAGGTSSTLSIPSVGQQDSGWYVALITDSYGTRRSAPMFVLVAPQSRARAWGYNGDNVTAIPADLTDPIAISATRAFAVLALNRDGSVKGWGDNFFGQATSPNGLADVVQVAVGYAHSLVLKSDGTVAAWGNSDTGGPLDIPAGLTGVVAIAAGAQRSVALKSDGTVVEWGSSTVPAGLGGVIAIAAGDYHTLGLKNDGTVVAWGSNSLGQCDVPVGLSGVVAISAGADHSLALKSDGTVVAWGYAGDGATQVPANLGNVVAISGGQRHSLALKGDGTVVGWGFDNYGETVAPIGLTHVWAISAGTYYSLALYDASAETTPVITTQPVSQTRAETQPLTLSVSALSLSPMTYQWRKNGTNIPGANSATFSLDHTALSDAGNYDVVVSNYLGATTSTTATLSVTPVPIISSLSPPRQTVAPGRKLSLSVTASGTGPLSYQWTHNGRPINGANSNTFVRASANAGDNGYYVVYISDSLGTRRSAPIFVNVAPSNGTVAIWANTSQGLANPLPSNLTNVVALAVNGDNALALKSDGTVVPWVAYSPTYPLEIFTPGSVYFYPIGFPAGLSDVVAVAAGGAHSLALKSDGTVVGWGDTTFSQSVAPAGLSEVVAIACGSSHSLALKIDGTVVAWGSNSWGESSVPAGLTDVVAISAGTYVSRALKADGTVVSWGWALYGASAIPGDLTGVSAIASGYSFALTLGNDGTVASWGNLSSNSIPAGLNNVVALTAGPESALALKSNGTLAAWNDNDYDAVHASITVPNGLSHVYAMAAGSFFELTASDPSPVFSVQPASDFNNDGHADIVWENAVSGQRYIWLMNGTNFAAGADLGTLPPEWRIAGTGDFNADGRPDILWENTVTGDRGIWLMNGWSVAGWSDLGIMPPEWHIAGTGDFNGDGQTDILWENTTTGQRYMWLMNGPSYAAGADLGTLPPEWRIAGTGDFNADGQTDILWENTVTGDRGIWLMNGWAVIGWSDLGIVPTDWRIARTGDFNGDGHLDIVWENKVTGERGMWLMNGVTVIGWAELTSISLDWRIAP